MKTKNKKLEKLAELKYRILRKMDEISEYDLLDTKVINYGACSKIINDEFNLSFLLMCKKTKEGK